MIHWGLYSLLAGEYDGKVSTHKYGEWIQSQMRIPNAEYEKLASVFNPIYFDADEWVALAKEAGMKYIVITSKHHEGFAMFDSMVERIQEDTVAMLVRVNIQKAPVHEEKNIIGARWSKLLINATFSGLGTVVGGVFGDVSEDKDGKKVAIRCMKECIDVGHAAGVTFAPVQGKNIVGLFYYKNALKRLFGCALLTIAMKKHRLIEPSMLQDLKKGKPCEVDAINGVVCEFGKKYGVPTPINDRIVEIIKKIQDGKLKAEKAEAAEKAARLAAKQEKIRQNARFGRNGGKGGKGGGKKRR